MVRLFFSKEEMVENLQKKRYTIKSYRKRCKEYEENIVNDSQWLELIQYETQNPNWRDHVTEKLCKFVGVTR